MSEPPKVTLRSFKPMWEGWIKGIIREVDQALRIQSNLSQHTRAATDDLEFTAWKVFSQLDWKTTLLAKLSYLARGLQEESKVEVQRALNLTQGLIHEIKEEG
jgi:hypothetical protein